MEFSSILISLLILIVTIIIYKIYSSRKFQASKQMGLSGPKPWPILGNLPALIKEGFLKHHNRLYKEFENEKIYVFHEPGKTSFVVKDLDMIRDICIKNFNSFVNRRSFVNRPPFSNLLSHLKDEHWRHVRKTVSPTFSSGKLKCMFTHVQESSRILQSNLKQYAKEEKSIELKDVLSCFSMDVIASTGFGVKIDSLNNKDTVIRKANLCPALVMIESALTMLGEQMMGVNHCEKRGVALLIDLALPRSSGAVTTPIDGQLYWNVLGTEDVLYTSWNGDFVTQAKNIINGFGGAAVTLSLFFPRLLWALEKIGIDVLPNKPALYFHSFVDEAVANRQKEETKRHDFLQLMIGAAEIPEFAKSESGQSDAKKITKADIQGTALIFIMGGYDTMATTLSYAVYLLAHHPECTKKVQEELDRVLDGKFPTYEHIPELTYLDMCLNESLRLFPPGFIMTRQCNEECNVGGVVFPKDSYAMVPVYGIHHDPKIWPEPEKFDPERFSAANKKGRHPFAHLPFGQGPRNCIAMRLALMEAKAALASILQEMTPVPCEKSVYPVVMENYSIRPVGGLWVKFEQRQI